MPILLNTSHPLYANIVACIGVDSTGTIVDAKGAQTLTPNAAVVVGSGTYGRHFRTSIVSTNAVGVAMSPGISTKPITGKAGTTFVVINAGNSRGSRGAVFNALAAVSPAVYTGDVAGISGATTPVVLGTTDLIGTGAHSFASGVNGDGGTGFSYTWVDGILENSSTGVGSSTDNASAFATYIGGNPTSGGYAGFAADYVWVIHFNRVLTTAEVADLHASIGVDTIGVVESAAAPDPSATLTWTEESDTSSITTNVEITTVSGTMAWTEANDTSAIAATVAASTGTIATTAFKNNTGTVLASLTGLTVTVLNLSTMAFVKTFTSQTTDASGVMTLNDALLVAGTEYAVVTANAAKTLGVEKYTAT